MFDDDLVQRLAALDADFKAAPTDFSMPEPGTYQGLVRSFDTFEGKADGTQYLKVVLEVANDPKYEGWEVEKVWTWIPSPNIKPEDARKRMGFFKKDLQTLGVPVEDEDFSLTQIHPGSQTLADLLDVPVEFAIVEGGDKPAEKGGGKYMNVYLNERLGGPVTPDVPNDVPPATEPTDDGADHPFNEPDPAAESIQF